MVWRKRISSLVLVYGYWYGNENKDGMIDFCGILVESRLRGYYDGVKSVMSNLLLRGASHSRK